ncbi:hypothetical protein BK131_04470 [Paenibacillus amylolyticus]|uniref:Uncharacterized protein n=1 Tax=Paenibacillus amylolyticus TaxID=1451 RepID=A0A1R1C566_PAEAM|nr:hypothetical protein [Paenibacillus amylolyticus]OMF17224.1 hypothetical protein BK131_04470 [Paenibacillus amylolyticus]
MKKDKAKEQRDFPEKKDLFYIIFFLVVVVVVLFVVKFEDPKFLVDQLSLGATLFSILLAVMAILISFIQSSESSKQSMQITKEISDQSGKIGTLSDQYAKFIEEQRKSSEETGEKVLETLEKSQDISPETKKEVETVIAEAKLKQNDAILDFESNFIHNINNISFNKYNKIEYDFLFNFIREHYDGSINVDVIKNDFEKYIGYRIKHSNLMLYLGRMEKKGFGKVSFRDNNGRTEMVFHLE